MLKSESGLKTSPFFTEFEKRCSERLRLWSQLNAVFFLYRNWTRSTSDNGARLRFENFNNESRGLRVITRGPRSLKIKIWLMATGRRNNELESNATFSILFATINRFRRTFLQKRFVVQWDRMARVLLSIFFYKINFLTFGTPQFQPEIRALNRVTSDFATNHFKLNSLAFTYRKNVAGADNERFMSVLAEREVGVIFLTDVNYHARSLFFLTKNHFFTIGLITHLQNPWDVSYALPTMNEGLLSQSFGYGFTLRLRQEAEMERYIRYQTKSRAFIFFKKQV